MKRADILADGVVDEQEGNEYRREGMEAAAQILADVNYLAQHSVKHWVLPFPKARVA